MAIPSVVQGLIEIEGGKVFELDSPKGAAWLESIGSFRFEPTGDAKPCTVRREPSGYWYGCRKIAGKVRKKYIGKSSEVSTAKLEEIAAALEVPPAPRVNKVAEVAGEVAQVAEVTQVAEVAQDRLTALELEVANLRKAFEALREALPGKLESGDSTELPKVAEELQNELGNLNAEPEDVEFLKRLLAKEHPLIPSDLWQEIERLKERNRQVRLKMGEERRESIEKISELERQNENLIKRTQQKQIRLDELEVAETELQNELGNLKTENENLRQELESIKQELTENTRYYTARLNEAGATLGTFKDKLEAAQAKNQRLQNDLGNSQTGVTELRSQLETERALREEEIKNLRRSLENSDRLVSKKNQEISELNSRLAVANQKVADSGEELSEQSEKLQRQDVEIENLKTETERLESELARLTGEVEAELADLSQLKKEVKEDAAEVHREGNAIKVERVRWQRELSDARAELADAKATILNQGNRIRELERGYSLKPNPAERRLRLEIGELQAQLSDLKQKSAAASELPEAADLLNQLKAKRKKSKTDLADVEAILAMIEE